MCAPHRSAQLLLLSLLLAVPARASFTDIGAGMTGVSTPGMAWGDYDGDGDLDLVVAGLTQAGSSARIYRNTAGVFDTPTALPTGDVMRTVSVAWGDYDNDGDLDLAMTGSPNGTTTFSRIYRNDAGVFVDSGAPIVQLKNSAVAWADYDNDGDLDLAISGRPTTGPSEAHVYRNTAGTFADASAGLVGVEFCHLAWADYDKDGDQDLVIVGSAATTIITTLYRNTAGTFTEASSGLPAVSRGVFEWCDFDNDGDPDLVLVGSTTLSHVYRNTLGSFADAGYALQGVSMGSAAWADVDNDGDGDLALCGSTGSTGFSAVYVQTATGMTDISAGLGLAQTGGLAWGDYDNDGDVDLAFAGAISGPPPFTRVYRNDAPVANTAPAAPSGLSVTADSATVTFHWNAASDAQQPSSGLSYNLWAGTSLNTPNVISPMAHIATGVRMVPQLGNAGQNLSWTLTRSAIAGNIVYWGVQAIDQSLAGSAFATAPATLLDATGPRASGLQLRVLGANPSRGEVRVAYTLPRDTHAELSVHDITGRRIGSLLNGVSIAGEHEARWNGGGQNGNRCAPGVYFLKLNAGGASSTARILRIE